MLYFGSFNPVHRGHIAVAEYAVEHNLCDMLVMIVSPQNPFKQSEELAPELARFEMAEAACAASRYPDRIVPSAIEFTLPRPSYTIDTLRCIASEQPDMQLSLLMGGDLAQTIDRWREGRTILDNYTIYMYPRGGVTTAPFKEVHVLDHAPQIECSATDIRARLARGESISDLVPDVVEHYIKAHGLWS